MKTLLRVSERKDANGNVIPTVVGKATLTGINSTLQENSNKNEFRRFNARLHLQQDDEGNIMTMDVLGQIYENFYKKAFPNGLKEGTSLNIVCDVEAFKANQFNQFSIQGRAVDSLDNDTLSDLSAALGI